MAQAHEATPLVPRVRPAQSQSLAKLDRELVKGQILSADDLDFINRPGQVMPTTAALKGMVGVSAASLAIEPLFSWFLLGTTSAAYEQILIDFFDVTLSAADKSAIYAFSAFFCLCNLLTDWQSISFASDVEEIYIEHLKKTRNGHEDKSIGRKILDYIAHGNNRTEKLKALLVSIIMFSSIPGFIQGALADNIPLADTIFSHISSLAGAWTLNSSLAIGIGFLGACYYYIFNRGKAVAHMDMLVDTLQNHKMEFLQNALRQPGAYLEVLSEILANALFRGVNFGYLTGQEAQHVLRLKPSQYNSATVTGIGVGTAVQVGALTVATRTQASAKDFLDPNFKLLRDEDLQTINTYDWSAKGIRQEILPDAGVSVVRGFGVGLFVGYSISTYPLNFVIGSAAGAVTAAGSYYVRLDLNQKKHALAELKKDAKKLKQREKEAINGNAKGKDPVAQLTKQELRYNRGAKLYAGIAENITIPVWIVWFGVIVNLIARFLARWPSFYTFAKDFFARIFDFNNAQNMGLTASAGAQVMFNDARTFGGNIENVHKNAVASYRLLTHEDEVNPASTPFGLFQQTRPARVVRAAFRARSGAHDMEILEDVYNTVTAGIVVEDDVEGDEEMAPVAPANGARRIGLGHSGSDSE